MKARRRAHLKRDSGEKGENGADNRREVLPEKDDEDEYDEKPVPLKRIPKALKMNWEKREQDFGTIQRGNRYEVENGEHDIDDHDEYRNVQKRRGHESFRYTNDETEHKGDTKV